MCKQRLINKLESESFTSGPWSSTAIEWVKRACKHAYKCVCVYIYIYIDSKREREIEGTKTYIGEKNCMNICACKRKRERERITGTRRKGIVYFHEVNNYLYLNNAVARRV